MTFSRLYWVYVIAVNLASLVLMARDKKNARKRRRRIRERTLLVLTCVGGAVGTWIGMVRFRHKTRHTRFQVLAPVFTVAWVILSLWLLYKGAIN